MAAFTLTVSDQGEMQHIAVSLASYLEAGSVIALNGDLGAGKTYFSQGLAMGLGVTDAVTSPTFTVLSVYTSGRLPLYHFDLYRLHTKEELENTSFYDHCPSDGVTCIEWASRFASELPDERIDIEIANTTDGRRCIAVLPRGARALHYVDLWHRSIRPRLYPQVEEAEEPETAKQAEALQVIQVPEKAQADQEVQTIEDTLTAKEAEAAKKIKEYAAAHEEFCPNVNERAATDTSSNVGGNAQALQANKAEYVLAFDTAHETIAIGVGKLDANTQTIQVLVSNQIQAFRASNTKLIACVEEALENCGRSMSDVACVVCGRGPGSFTGVRICMATAKGLALGCGCALYGVSTLDAQAWDYYHAGGRGNLVVLGDAMRKEVYPVRYTISDDGIARHNEDCVIKAAQAPDWIRNSFAEADTSLTEPTSGTVCKSNLGERDADIDNALSMSVTVTGDALSKYREQLSDFVQTPEETWNPTGAGLLAAAQDKWQKGTLDPLNSRMGNPYTVLPVYTRLSDAEENERMRFAKNQLAIKGECLAPAQGEFRNSSAMQIAASGVAGSNTHIRYQPLDAAWVPAVAQLEAQAMGSDAWNENQLNDELPRADRTWWAAYAFTDDAALGELLHVQVVTPETPGVVLVGYAGGWIVDGQLQILKVATNPAYRRCGIARALLARVANDARDLGATTATLEVRASNTGAHAFYEELGLTCIGVRPRYYSDREDACIYSGPLPLAQHDVAGMNLLVNTVAFGNTGEGANHAQDAALCSTVSAPAVEDAKEHSVADETTGAASIPQTLIVAFETSCDETAAAIIDGEGTVLADVVASQIDFHARFGGVVPEIASRKHIEAIAGVAQEVLHQAQLRLNAPQLSWNDMSAVAVTYAPGLVGALVVGLAFAKGLAYATNKPLIGVNHLEGHLYANKLACPDIKPPMVVSLVSGGHTMLVHVKDWGSYETLGTTLDDAVGEAFDKVAKALGLGYPGGPLISKLAETGDPKAIQFPRALLHSGDLQFSLSGLKTAVLTYLNKEKAAERPINNHDVAASFQAAVVDVQVAKARDALRRTGAKEFCLGGGVAANPALRHAYEEMCNEEGVRLTMPPLSACTDNASMIALVALDRYKQGKFFEMDCDVQAHASLDEPY